MMSRAFRIWPVLLAIAVTAQADPPVRVISLAPNLTDIVLHLGAGESLAAVTPFCAAPQDVPRVAGGLQPEAETILAIGPDLVLASVLTPAPTLRQLHHLGIRTETLATGSLEQIRTATARLAGIFGKEATQDPAPEGHEVTQTAVLLFGADTAYSAGSGTHAHEILEAAGLQNLAAEASGPWPQLGEEFLLAADPDVIIVADYGAAKKEAVIALLRGHPLRKHWKAVREGRVVVFPARAFSIPGPAALQAGQTLRDEMEKL